jgi:AcrR family transcriptional regulator
VTSVYNVGMAGLRARVREELTEEIKRLARQQLVEHGASELSLRAIARDMDMASSAIYRYFASRDELLTALIIDAYDAIGAVAEQTDLAHQRSSIANRFVAIGLAAYQWAKDHPAEYGLIYGTPIPGYRAPTDTVAPATRFSRVLLGLLDDGERDGSINTNDPIPTPRSLRSELRRVNELAGTAIAEPVMARGMASWISMFGTISFVLFGHLHNVIEDNDTFVRNAFERAAASVVGY